MDPIAGFLEKVKLARAQSCRNLTMYPLLAPPDEAEPNYLTLEQALAEGLVEIAEMGEQGHVPELIFRNRGGKAVLVLDGEELVGAKQNRIVNITLLIPAKSKVVIPVSCVEQGRWHYRTRTFDSGEKIMHASLRASHQRAVDANLKDYNSPRSNQSMIWGELGQKAMRMHIEAPTGAMSDLFERQEGSLREYLAAFRLVDGQVGAVFAISGRLVGMDCLGYNATFASFFPKLIKSYALDALDEALQQPKDQETAKGRPDKSRRFLDSVATAAKREYRTVGEGESLRFDDRQVSGAALVLEGKVLHLAAFSRNENREREDERLSLQRASARRRRVLN
jgi:hypothetical protein